MYSKMYEQVISFGNMVSFNIDTVVFLTYILSNEM